MQVSEQDGPWCDYLMEHLPDTDDEDDLTDLNNRRGIPLFVYLRERKSRGLGLLSHAREQWIWVVGFQKCQSERLPVTFHVDSCFFRESIQQPKKILH